ARETVADHGRRAPPVEADGRLARDRPVDLVGRPRGDGGRSRTGRGGGRGGGRRPRGGGRGSRRRPCDGRGRAGGRGGRVCRRGRRRGGRCDRQAEDPLRPAVAVDDDVVRLPRRHGRRETGGTVQAGRIRAGVVVASGRDLGPARAGAAPQVEHGVEG